MSTVRVWVEHTVWLTQTIEVDDAKRETALASLKAMVDAEDHEGLLSGYYSVDHETLEYMTVDENDGCATIEVSDGDGTLFHNGSIP